MIFLVEDDPRIARVVKALLEEHYQGTGWTIGAIKDEGEYFQVEIRDAEGKTVDNLVVHKKTCRMRSIRSVSEPAPAGTGSVP